ncbi:MAG: glycerophosphodiester phosphodiesterase [Methyloligellaceae bacterium]
MHQPADGLASLIAIATLAVMKLKLLMLLCVLTASVQAGQPISPLSSQSTFKPSKIMVIGHRGAAGSAPENTLAAIKEALKQGVDAIEVDLHQSADGVVVAIHDDTVDRTTDGKGKVADLTIEQLKELDAGGWFDAKFAGEQIPTLEEVLRAVPDKTVLILEVKEGSETYPGIERRIIDGVRQAERTNVILKSFSIEVLKTFERIAPDYVRLYVFNAHIPFLNLIVDDWLRFGNAFDQNVSWLQKHSSFITDGFVRRAQERKIQVVAWNVHDPAMMREMIDLRVDAIETDYPAVLKRMLAKAVKAPAEAVR